MTDKDIILDAYAEVIKEAFRVYFGALVGAKTAADKETAENKFKSGVAFARQTRDQALVVLGL